MADDPQTGVVVVALPAADDPVQGIGPEQKHATLLYFGDIPGGSNPNELLTEDFATLLRSVLATTVTAYGQLTEEVTDVEPLGDSGAHVWMLAGTKLPDLRSDLLDTDSELVGPLEAVTQYPSYTPHVTIGYEAGADLTQGDSDEPLTDGDLDAAAEISEITFDRLALWWAGEQYEYPLIGTADPGRGSATESHTRPGGPMSKQVHESTRLVAREGAAGAPATRKMIQIITPGWGSSGYYSAEVLEKAAKDRVIPKGTHMYLNHASESERTDRPEREVEKIAAVLVEDAVWDGKALMGPADLMGPHAELIEAVAPYIGVSISGSASDITIGEAEGRTGPIIEGLAVVNSVDFVTHAGRGGMVLLESARPSLVNALAVEHGIAESTANETRELLSQALRELFPGEKVWVWVRDFDDTTVWYEHETTEDAGTYSLAYSLSDDGVVTFSGSPVEVRPETNYVPVTPGGTTDTEEAEAMAADPNKGAAEPAPAAAAASGTEPVAESSPIPSHPKENDMTDNPTGAGGIAAPTQEAAPAAPRNPREVMEAQMREQGRQIALLRAGQMARGIVAEVLAQGWIGEAQAARLTNELIAEANLPLTEDHTLDEAKLRAKALARLDEAETEAAEILASAGVGQVKGLGSTTRATEVALHAYDEDVSESLKVFGLSESATEIAVKGR